MKQKTCYCNKWQEGKVYDAVFIKGCLPLEMSGRTVKLWSDKWVGW